MTYAEKNDGYVTSSKLKEFMRCGFCYKAKYIDRLEDVMEDRDCFTVGQAFDDLVTQGEGYYKKNYAVVKRRDKEAEVTELTEGQGTLIRQMEKEFRANPVYKQNPTKQVFTLDFAGLKLRGELDDVEPEKQMIRDVKTCANVTTFRPESYIPQMAFYQFLIEEVTGVRCSAMLEVVDKYTYFSRSLPIQYTADTLFAERGRIIQAFENLKIAQETGIYLPSDDQKILYECPFYGLITPEFPHGHGRPVEPLIY